MVKVLAAAGCVAVLVACDSAVAPPRITPSPTISETESPAAVLRVQMDRLFVEHTIALAKMTLAAGAGRHEEFRAYAGVLAANGSEVSALFASAVGVTAGGKIGAAWTDGNNYAVDYIVASATHDGDRAQTAMQQLSTNYVNELSTALLPNLPPPSDNVPKNTASEVTGFKTLVDDAVAGSYPAAFTDLALAVARASGSADVLADGIAHEFPDRYPGDALHESVNARAEFGVSLTTEAGYYSMLTEAVVAKAAAEQGGATQAITSNAAALPPPTEVWSQETALLVAYAATGNATAREKVLSRASAPLDLTSAFEALLKVIDDQRSRAYGSLGDDDRASAAAFAAVADVIATGSSPSS
ncbi:MAG TPA: hypothetical protein VFB69_03360 [Candidatus Dormibacteraeota bacterium]|nr:hypothetical protein [Candidatus Dormibacteraeota bacterium]